MSSVESIESLITDVYGADVFADAMMRERLPKAVYRKLRQTIDDGTELDPSIADVIANAMKDWAIERGATHFCHWFQPMTGLTAEKHDSFISPTSAGTVLMEFSGKELTQGEPDASSFPSGGLRATFEARGYTAWDCTSPVFVKGNGNNRALFVPSAFCSYRGEALDKKTPLLRSMEAINSAAIRVLRLLGNQSSNRVLVTLGGEQEYFLVDRSFVERRLDLLLTHRTLFGSPPPKGQEMEDHYFGNLHERIGSFMADLNRELWRLGVSAKTQHNEVAPGQYEIAPIFDTVNVAVDRNHLTMEALEKIAGRHGFVCLLHEKPFAGINGSGKHNNWSLCTDDGLNLLDPGVTPHENMQFLVFLFAVIRAVDKYADLLRATVASAGNDHRLGANEAPPAIVSVFLGDQLIEIFEQIRTGATAGSKKGGTIKLGVTTLPPLPKDLADRNRTSPFAFTGNKFEFRMVGSYQSLSGSNFVLNAAVAEVLNEIAAELEPVPADEFNDAIQKLLKKYARAHERVVFNGNNYCEDWHSEAEVRGLPNLRTTPEALKVICDKKNVKLLASQKVLQPGELKARQEILFEQYRTLICIEARTMLQMSKRQILPACIEFSGRLATTVAAVKNAGADPEAQTILLKTVNAEISALDKAIKALESALGSSCTSNGSSEAQAFACRDKIIPAMNKLRQCADSLETMVDAELWPLPTYADMLFKR